MEELENRMVREEPEHHVDFDEYDRYMEALAEKEDKNWEDRDD